MKQSDHRPLAYGEAPCLIMLSSHKRAAAVLSWADSNVHYATASSLTELLGEEINLFELPDAFTTTFWQVVAEHWCGFDLIDHHHFARLFARLRDTYTTECMSEEDRAFFEQLPDELTVYRGGDAATVLDGLSWTLEWDTAAGFARGHRGMFNNNPVIIVGKVAKRDIVLATNTREEKEIVVFHPELVKERYVAEVLTAEEASA